MTPIQELLQAFNANGVFIKHLILRYNYLGYWEVVNKEVNKAMRVRFYVTCKQAG